MTELSRAALAQVDPSDMLGDVLSLPHQLEDATWRVDAAGVPSGDARAGLLVCGMGGSAIGGELAAAVIGTRARRPVGVYRGFDPGPLARDALVLCSSYSGETEETVSCFEAAGAAGVARVALTTGGALAEAARAEGVPVIGIPAGMMPRAAAAYTVVAALSCAAACGAAPPLVEEVRAARDPLLALAAEWGPDAAEDSRAKTLARRLQGRLPVVYGAGATVAVARRWKAQFNENAKLPAFAAPVPEVDHNELCAYERAHEVAPLHPVVLDDPAGDPRLRRRLRVLAEVLSESEGAAGVDVVEARGGSALERVLSLLLLGDLVSVYLAALDGVDPTPIDALSRFNERLARS